MTADRMACWLQDGLKGAKLSPSWPKLAPRWAQGAPGIILQDFAVVRRPFLGPSWAILGPPWPFSRGPGGHLEADFGFGRLDLGVQGG